jgi:ABC-type glutathione transport system ATPase component
MRKVCTSRGFLTPRLETPGGGQIRLDGDDVLAREPRQASLGYRGRAQWIFQDQSSSLNPVLDVAHHLGRPLRRRRVTFPEGRTAEGRHLRCHLYRQEPHVEVGAAR